mgnify:CR=1 FL=1
MIDVIRRVKRIADSTADVLGVVGGLSAIRGNLKKVVAGEVKKEGAAEDQKQSETQVRMGGIFDLSDEIVFGEALTKLQIDPECAEKNYHLVVSQYLNTLPHDWQRRHFRVVVGKLIKAEYIKSWERIPVEGKSNRFKEVAIKANLGVEFLKIIAVAESNKERNEICEAAGILSSPQEIAEKEIKKAAKAIGKFNKSVAGPPYRGFWTEITRGKAK